MSAKPLLGALVLGTGVFVLVAATWDHPDPVAAPPPVHEEPQWLSKEAAAQIFGEAGGLGPLFEGSMVGGSAPSPETRGRIAAFAKANHVDIDLEIRDDELRAVKFAVTFGGCCGYEGVDVLALRLGRPRYSESCGGPREWIDNWVVNVDDGSRMRARAHINQLTVRWEPRLTLPELMTRADSLVGKRASTVAREAGETWKEIEPGALYLLEVPFAFISESSWPTPEWRSRIDLGFQLRVEAGTITEVAFALPYIEEATMEQFSKRWGKMRELDDVRTWSPPGRRVTIDQSPTMVRIAAR